MEPEEIDRWLISIAQDRAWLKDKLGISMGTLYNGFSKGFSPRSLKAIRSLKEAEAASPNGLQVIFTADEFERIEEARKLIGTPTRKLFYEQAITEFTDDILAREQRIPLTIPHPPLPSIEGELYACKIKRFSACVAFE